MHQYKEVLDGDLGTLPGQLHLEVNTSIKPVQDPRKTGPVGNTGDIDQGVSLHGKTGMIKKADEPS